MNEDRFALTEPSVITIIFSSCCSYEYFYLPVSVIILRAAVLAKQVLFILAFVCVSVYRSVCQRKNSKTTHQKLTELGRNTAIQHTRSSWIFVRFDLER